MFEIIYIPILLLVLWYTYKTFLKIFGLFIVPPRESKDLKAFYEKYSHYFNQLSPKHQKRFIYRAYSLSRIIKVIGRQGFVIDKKMVLYVVAAYVQITFGFNYYNIPRFKTVIIYPDSFRSPFTGKMHDGEVNPRGVIVLSWKKLVRGFSDPHDKINLGLHEMAHALMHTIIHSNRHEPGLDAYLNKVIKLSSEEVKKINKGDSHLFRSYAGKSIEEFFAIATEHFFEGPKEFRSELPDLYNKMKYLLKQDPANGIYIL